jgi:hypothetical protein
MEACGNFSRDGVKVAWRQEFFGINSVVDLLGFLRYSRSTTFHTADSSVRRFTIKFTRLAVWSSSRNAGDWYREGDVPLTAQAGA